MNFLFNFFQQLFKNNPTDNYQPSDKILVARVLDVQKHPNADRLRVVKLDIGDKVIEPVVCGAFNFGVGDIVALALPGARIAQNIHTNDHQPFTLNKATIRGIESHAMICAAFELGLGPLSNKPEILILKPAIAPGSQFFPEMILWDTNQLMHTSDTNNTNVVLLALTEQY